MHEDHNEHHDEDNLPAQDGPELYNSIEIVLNKEAFYDDEEVFGHVLITIQEAFYPRRLTIGIIGEVMSQTFISSKKDRDNYRKKTTMIPSLGSPGLGRTFTAVKNTNHETNEMQSPLKKTVTRTFTRTMTMITNKSTRASGTKILPIEEVKNRELFCHYIIPVFTFKTEKLPEGTYKIPFRFLLSSEVLPSFNYDRDNFHFNICYTAVAELEENPEAGHGNSFYVGDNSLKSKKDLKIFKASTRKSENSSTTRIVNNEVVGRLKAPELLCIRPQENKIKLKLEKNGFRLGDQVNFEVISYDKPLKQKKTKLTANLIEELRNFGEAVNSFQTPLETFDIKFEQENERKTIVKGSVILGGASKKGFRPSSENIEHVFELVLGYKAGFTRNYISLRIPITIKPQRTEEVEGASPLLTNKDQSINDEEEDEESEGEDIITLPLAKFKLEERFNLLSKAAQILEEGF